MKILLVAQVSGLGLGLPQLLPVTSARRNEVISQQLLGPRRRLRALSASTGRAGAIWHNASGLRGVEHSAAGQFIPEFSGLMVVRVFGVWWLDNARGL